MKTDFYSPVAARLWVLLMIGSCISCSSILRASQLATPDGTTTQPGSSLVQWAQPKEGIAVPDGQRPTIPLLGRPTMPTPMGSQWVFVVKESQANGQFKGCWLIMPVGQEINP